MNVERPVVEQQHVYGERERMHRGGPSPVGMWFSAFAIGAAVGGVLGLLYAPRRGREIRATLFETLPGQGVSPEFRARVARTLAAGGTSPGQMSAQAQRELDELRSQAYNKISDARLRAKIMRKEAELRYLKGKEKLREEVEP